MAFITYILLAGMALGIQKRWVNIPHLFLWWFTVVHQKSLKKKVSVDLCVQIQPRGPWNVCQHCPRLDHHRSAGPVAEFVSADGTQRPLNVWSHRLQWIQICWVNGYFIFIFMNRYKSDWTFLTTAFKNVNSSKFVKRNSFHLISLNSLCLITDTVMINNFDM